MVTSKRSLLLSALCALSLAPSVGAQSMPRIQGTLRVSPSVARDSARVMVSVLLENRTAQEAVFPVEVLSSAQLLIELRDGRNAVVAPMSPAVPSGRTSTIGAGQSRRIEFSLASFSSQALAPGRYTVRFRGAIIVGTPVTFTIRR
jgi:hypothetical protein